MSEVLVTVLGMLAAFVTAFLVEPVKLYFQNISRLKKLRIALYKETFHNFMICKSILVRCNRLRTYKELNNYILGLEKDFRTAYYDQILKNDLESYYQLKEAATFHTIYDVELKKIRDALSYLLQDAADDQVDLAKGELKHSADMFCHTIKSDFFVGKLDKRLLKKIASNEDGYKEISSFVFTLPRKITWQFWK